jgi:hypothetical protein
MAWARSSRWGIGGAALDARRKDRSKRHTVSRLSALGSLVARTRLAFIARTFVQQSTLFTQKIFLFATTDTFTIVGRATGNAASSESSRPPEAIEISEMTCTWQRLPLCGTNC